MEEIAPQVERTYAPIEIPKPVATPEAIENIPDAMIRHKAGMIYQDAELLLGSFCGLNGCYHENIHTGHVAQDLYRIVREKYRVLKMKGFDLTPLMGCVPDYPFNFTHADPDNQFQFVHQAPCYLEASLKKLGTCSLLLRELMNLIYLMKTDPILVMEILDRTLKCEDVRASAPDTITDIVASPEERRDSIPPRKHGENVMCIRAFLAWDKYNPEEHTPGDVARITQVHTPQVRTEINGLVTTPKPG